MRKKETEEDYRYFPDPDIPPVLITKEMIEKVRKEIPELPRQKSARFVSDYSIKPDDAWILVSEIELANLFEDMVKENKGREQALASWIRGPLKKQLNYRNLLFKDSGLVEAGLSGLFGDFSDGKITDDGMEMALIAILDKKKDYETIKKELGIGKIMNIGEVDQLTSSVLKENPKVVEDYKKGGEKSLNFLVGQVVKLTKGKADARVVKDLIKKKVG